MAVRRRSRIKVLLRCFFVTAFALLLRSPGTMTNPRHHCTGPCSSRKMQKREESPQKGEREIGKGIRRVTITRRWLHGPLCKDNGVRDDKRVSPLSLCQGSEMILMSGWKGEGTVRIEREEKEAHFFSKCILAVTYSCFSYVCKINPTCHLFYFTVFISSFHNMNHLIRQFYRNKFFFGFLWYLIDRWIVIFF